MKPVVIIAIVFALLIPTTIFAYEPSQWEKDTCRDWVDKGISDSYDECIADAIKDGEERETPRIALYSIIGIVLLIITIVLVIRHLKRDKSEPIEVDVVNTWEPPVRKGWTPDEKEQVRIRQDGKCAHCSKPPPRWEYHHMDEDRSNNSLDNCEGLCPNCHSVETHEGSG